MHILIIDDTPEVRETLEVILGIEGYTTSGAKNGKEGLELMRAGSFDLIFSDINMPVMDGIDFFKSVCERMPEMKDRVVFMSGGYTDEQATFIKNTGNRFFEKPFDLKTILKVLEGHV